MQSMYYLGLDVHKKKISYCVKGGSGQIHSQGTIPATRLHLDRRMKTLPQPWTAAMEATLFTGWIYDHLKPHAAALIPSEIAHHLMHFDDHFRFWAFRERHRLDVRIDHCPLSRPVAKYSFAPVDMAPFHAVCPK